MNHSGLYKLAGRCALGYACLSLAGYAAWIYASGFVAATSAPPSPERLLQLAQTPASQLSARLDLVSYFLFIPALDRGHGRQQHKVALEGSVRLLRNTRKVSDRRIL